MRRTQWNARPLVIILIFLFAVSLIPVLPASAAGYVVSTTADTNDGVCDADCSMREAITAANADPADDTITFDAGANGTITLLSALPTLANNGTLTINGNGAENTIISGNDTVRGLRVGVDAVVAIDGVTVTHGYIDGNGGGIRNDGTLTLTDGVITGNSATVSSGGILNFGGGTLTVIDSMISGNSVTTDGGFGGGGIFNYAGTLILTDSTVTGNETYDRGGGIYNYETVVLTNATISDNNTTADYATGGGIFNFGELRVTDSTISGNHTFYGGGIVNANTGILEVTDSTITGNTADNSGGGIWNTFGGWASLTNSTISNNAIIYNQGAGIYNHADASTLIVLNSIISGNTIRDFGDGGGISNDNGGTATVINSVISDNEVYYAGAAFSNIDATLTVINSTISGNSAHYNGGLFNTGGGTTTFINTIMANTSPGIFGECYASGTINAYNSLFEDGLGCVSGADVNNLTGDPALNPDLTLSATSIAIDAGDDVLAVDADGNPLLTDLAGNARIQHAAVDMGAYESPYAENMLTVGISPSLLTVEEGDNANFIVGRTGDTSGDLVVNLIITQSANMLASDYTLSGASISGQMGNVTVTIPAGSASVAVNFAAADDIDAEAENSLSVVVLDGGGSGYHQNNVTNAVARIPANDFVVTNTNDSGEGSLRQAVENANHYSTDDVITFAPSANGTIIFESLLVIEGYSSRLTIIGNGTANTRFSGDHTSSILRVSSGNLTLEGVTLVNGVAEPSDTGTAGGAIESYSSVLTITDSLFSGNYGDYGGAIASYSYPSTLTVSDSTFTGNSALEGGAIYLDFFAFATITDSTFTDNSASSSGGDIILRDGGLDVLNSIFSGGSTDGTGGSIANLAYGTTTVTNSTLSGGSADLGGALYNDGALTVTNSTINGSSAVTSGGALYQDVNEGTTTINNTILANSISGGDCAIASGTINAQNSLIADGLDCVNGTSTNNLIGDPALNSDLTLKDTSTAIDAGDNALAVDVEGNPLTIDLAGNPRIQNTTVDMGAYESTPTSLTLQLTLQGRSDAPNAAWVITAHVEVRPAGGGAAVLSGDYVSDTNGQIVLPHIPAGSYNIWVKGTHTLAVLQAVTVVSGANNVTTATLQEGDANDNNNVNISDFSILALVFGKGYESVGYDARADFNGDNAVTINDFSLMTLNFTQSGTP